MSGQKIEGNDELPILGQGSRFCCVITDKKGSLLRVLGPFAIIEIDGGVIKMEDLDSEEILLASYERLVQDIDELVPPRHNGTNPPGYSGFILKM
jgi:hypothetical protein